VGVHIGRAGRGSYYVRDDLAASRDHDGVSWRRWLRPPDWREAGAPAWGDGDDALLGEMLSGRRRGRALCAGLGRGGRRVRGYDLDVSADKPVSILWALADNPADRARIEAAHLTAVGQVADAVAALPFAVRSGAGGAAYEPAHPPVAVVSHLLARPEHCPEHGVVAAPHLHDHCVVANLARRADGALRSLYARPLYASLAMLDRIYCESLDRELKSLGLEPRREGGRLHLAEVDERLVAAFSPRRQALERASAGLAPREAARLRARLARRDRRAKEPVDLVALRARWREMATAVLEAGTDPAPELEYAMPAPR
jgi:conjugative relaxase-like TrwC/TraI family protein